MKRLLSRVVAGAIHHPKTSLLSIVTLLGLAISIQVAEAQNVRGQATFPNGIPAAGAFVKVCAASCTGLFVTGPDGMYYVYAVPPGQYQLLFFVSPNSPPSASYQIVVFPQPWTDIPPLRVF